MAFSFLLIFTNIYHATKMGRCAGSRDHVRRRSHASSSFLPTIYCAFLLTHIPISPTLFFSLFVLALLLLTTRKELWRSKWAYICLCLLSDWKRLLLLVSSSGESLIFPTEKRKKESCVSGVWSLFIWILWKCTLFGLEPFLSKIPQCLVNCLLATES
jgi:hypothetical protein